MTTRYAYKILTASDWSVAQELGHTDTKLDRTDGYVHLSTAAQAGETARLYYSGKPACALLEFDMSDFDDVRWEASRGGDLFPHIYGVLEISKAQRQWVLELDGDGCPILPEDLQS